MFRGSERGNLFRMPGSWPCQAPPTFLQLHFGWVWLDLQLCCSSRQLILTERVPQQHRGPGQTPARSEDDNKQSPCRGFGLFRLRPLWVCKCVMLLVQPPQMPLPPPWLTHRTAAAAPADLPAGPQPARRAALPAGAHSGCHRSVGVLGAGTVADREDSSQRPGICPPGETTVTALGRRTPHLWCKPPPPQMRPGHF